MQTPYCLVKGVFPMYVQIWLIALLVFLIAEIVTVSLVSIWFVGGASVALIAAVLGAPLWTQIALFVVVSAALILALRPLTKKYFKPQAKFGTDRLIGMQAVVTERIDNLGATGAVHADGKEWSARTEDGSVLEVGSVVTILSIDGVKVIVKPCETKGETE